MDVIKELKGLADKTIFINTVFESIGSDEWVFGWEINYLEEKDWSLKRRVPAFKQKKSFTFSGGATYIGGWYTIEEALIDAIGYAKKILLPNT